MTCPLNYLLLETDDFNTFCYFHSPFPSSRAVWAIFFNSINYLAEMPSITYLESLAYPFSRRTFLTSIPSLETMYPIKLSLDNCDIFTLTSLCKNEDYKTDLIALALFLVSPSTLIKVYLKVFQ